MRSAVRAAVAALVGLVTALQMGGCPQVSTSGEVIDGSPGETSQVRSEASVTVLTPASSLSITGGTQVEVNWQAFATTRFALIDVFFDVDQVPDNGNEIDAFTNLPLGSNNALLDTTNLDRGTYNVGVSVKEVGSIVAFGYAPGQVSIDQRSKLTFVSPRGNVVFDRTNSVTPRFTVEWTVEDPDSQVTVDILLDPDDTPNGNEILLYKSESQASDSFTFNLPTASFDAGTYRILATVNDGQRPFYFYAPATIRLRARVAGIIDLRDVDIDQSRMTGAVFEGFNPRDDSGSFVSSIGDIDADGFDDFVIVAQFGKPSYQVNLQRTGIGEAYLIYGRQRRFAGVNNLNSTGTLFRGEFFGGVPEVPDPIRPTRGIRSLTILSDWDRDGVREIAWGVPFVDSEPIGARLESYGSFRTGGVIISAGSSLGLGNQFSGGHVYSLDDFGTIPFEANTEAPCCEGFYGPHAPIAAGGCTYFYRHTADADIDVESRREGARIWTNDFGDQCGEMVSTYDFDSILISVPNRDPSVCTSSRSVPGGGVVSLYFSSASGGFYLWDSTRNSLPHGGPYHYVLDDLRAFTAATQGGITLLPGSPGYYVDPDDAEPPCIILVDADTPEAGRTTRFYGSFDGAHIGNAVSTDDFNADGIRDILIGSPLSNSGAGASFIILGRLPNMIVGEELNLAELGLPMDSSDPLSQRVFDGIRVIGAPGDRLGQFQASAGDFNNDGISDVIIGSPYVNSRRGGAAVFFGSRDVINLTQEGIPFDELDTRGLGVIFEGVDEGDFAGGVVANAGDVDGDGNSDILIVAPHRSVKLDVDLDGVVDIDRTDCGVVYLVYGSPALTGRHSLADIGTDSLPGAMFIGRNSGDELGAGIGLQGDRSIGVGSAGDVDGDGFADLLLSSINASPRDRAKAGETYLLYGRGD